MVDTFLNLLKGRPRKATYPLARYHSSHHVVRILLYQAMHTHFQWAHEAIDPITRKLKQK
jgi:hypothetical protein